MEQQREKRKKFEIIQEYISQKEHLPQMKKRKEEAEREIRVGQYKLDRAERIIQAQSFMVEFCKDVFDMAWNAAKDIREEDILDFYDGDSTEYRLYEFPSEEQSTDGGGKETASKITGPYARFAEMYAADQDFRYQTWKHTEVICDFLKQMKPRLSFSITPMYRNSRVVSMFVSA